MQYPPSICAIFEAYKFHLSYPVDICRAGSTPWLCPLLSDIECNAISPLRTAHTCNLICSTSEEARRAARVIPERDSVNAVVFMRYAIEDAETGRQQNGGGATVGAVLVDPSVGQGRLVATASRERQIVLEEGPASMRGHPLHHPVMLCVQGVGRALAARKQGAEAGGKLPPRGGEEERAESDTIGGMGKGSGSTGSAVDSGCGVVEAVSPEQYLCTGFDLYITREPCLM